MGPDYTGFMQKYEEYFKIVREESVRGMIITRLLEALEQPSEPTTIGRLVKDRRLTELLLQPVDCQSFKRACQYIAFIMGSPNPKDVLAQLPTEAEHVPGLRAALRKRYIGNADDYLYGNVTGCGTEMDTGDPRYYPRFRSIVQSSGTGETRTLIELMSSRVRGLDIDVRLAEEMNTYLLRDNVSANILAPLVTTLEDDNYTLFTARKSNAAMDNRTETPESMFGDQYFIPMNGPISFPRLDTESHPTNWLKPTTIREKICMAQQDIGEPLYQAKTVGQFLRVMYDVCAVQRNLYRKARLIHQDISDQTIMIAPPNDEIISEDWSGGFNEVKYINQVLNGGSGKPQPACLLVDSTVVDASRNHKVLAERMRTPRFSARAISCGTLLCSIANPSGDLKMPELHGTALDLYRSTYPDRQYERDNLLLLEHPALKVASEVPFEPRLFHNAESVFWVIIWVLIHSSGPSKEATCPQYLGWAIDIMANHFPQSAPADTRNNLILKSSRLWKTILHPDLHFLDKMLCQMGIYVHPEWAHREGLALYEEHVHEALMRLLLMEIVQIEEKGDIQLGTGERKFAFMS